MQQFLETAMPTPVAGPAAPSAPPSMPPPGPRTTCFNNCLAGFGIPLGVATAALAFCGALGPGTGPFASVAIPLCLGFFGGIDIGTVATCLDQCGVPFPTLDPPGNGTARAVDWNHTRIGRIEPAPAQGLAIGVTHVMPTLSGTFFLRPVDLASLAGLAAATHTGRPALVTALPVGNTRLLLVNVVRQT